MTESTERRTRAGVAYALAAFGAWGLNPIYFKAVEAVPVIEIVGHRVVWSLPLLGLMVWQGGQWRQVLLALTARRVVMTLAASALVIGTNWLLYIHAVVSSQVLEASIGYYINPLVNILFGRLFLGERLTRLQVLAVTVAGAGILNLALAYGHVPWLGLSLAVSFAVYGLIRKTAPVESLPGLFIETLLLFPFALALLAATGGFVQARLSTDLLLVLAGPVSALPLLWFNHAAKRLRFGVVGFFQFLAPSGQFLLAVFAFGEHFGTAYYITFACIWTAIAIFTLGPRILPVRRRGAALPRG